MGIRSIAIYGFILLEDIFLFFVLRDESSTDSIIEQMREDFVPVSEPTVVSLTSPSLKDGTSIIKLKSEAPIKTDKDGLFALSSKVVEMTERKTKNDEQKDQGGLRQTTKNRFWTNFMSLGKN